jgi:hypothetical protein
LLDTGVVNVPDSEGASPGSAESSGGGDEQRPEPPDLLPNLSEGAIITGPSASQGGDTVEAVAGGEGGIGGIEAMAQPPDPESGETIIEESEGTSREAPPLDGPHSGEAIIEESPAPLLDDREGEGADEASTAGEMSGAGPMAQSSYSQSGEAIIEESPAPPLDDGEGEWAAEESAAGEVSGVEFMAQSSYSQSGEAIIEESPAPLLDDREGEGADEESAAVMIQRHVRAVLARREARRRRDDLAEVGHAARWNIRDHPQSFSIRSSA